MDTRFKAFRINVYGDNNNIQQILFIDNIDIKT